MDMEKVQQLQKKINAAHRIVFFGGAGVSTESGIPDFRSQDGLYHQQYDVPPETILSRTYFDRHPAEFYRFYRNKMICLTAKPNAAHKKLAELEQAGRLLAVVTQNIDGLHQMAGSRNVLELHGSVHRNICRSCGAVYDAEWVMMTNGIPHCDKCGGMVKPDVVLYEESLSEDVLTRSISAIASADLLIVGGTSLVVYPAAGLLRYFQGDSLVLINRDATQMDKMADLCIRDAIGAVMEQIQVPEKEA
ncbi:NAD-dependent protein deacylase [Ruminococcus sp. CAG:330]|uniref:NAD-dependent protein deacylase n=1 Tax=Ruminococcus sp. CAG:330 TaxID=1262954 RepID=UPI00033B4D0B|nr:NAD-dependent protein deacylase [Ruminococcus sp. CAG:330]CDE13695.1 nAD-dependent deacetylase [Ruminococcus sp. CAG:330]